MDDRAYDKNNKGSADITKEQTEQRDGRETSAELDRDRNSKSDQLSSNDPRTADKTKASQSQSGSTNFVGSKGETDTSKNMVDEDQRSSGRTPSGK